MAKKNSKKSQTTDLQQTQPIELSILVLRNEKIMLDRDLAQLYGVETRILIQAVKRNIRRFPSDFMFQLTKEELENWRSQIVMSNSGGKMGLRRLPYAFTEHGVAMLSSVLRSDQAIDVNIEIMRAFARFRRILTENKELARKLEKLERKYDKQFRVVFDAIRKLMEPTNQLPSRPIGFKGS